MTNQTQTTVHVPLKEAKPATAKIDLADLSESDLSSLKRDDPFLYHSIPSVYRATLRLQEIDHSELEAERPVVARKSRLSTETDMVNLIDDLLRVGDEEFWSRCRELGIDASDPLVDTQSADEQ